jgi:transposase
MPDPDHCTLMSAARMIFAHLSISHLIRAANSLGVLATPEQQSGLVLHRTRHLLTRQQTAVINAIRAHLAEFGIVAPVGRKGVEELLRVVADGNDKRVLDVVRACLGALGTHTGSV